VVGDPDGWLLEDGPNVDGDLMSVGDVMVDPPPGGGVDEEPIPGGEGGASDGFEEPTTDPVFFEAPLPLSAASMAGLLSSMPSAQTPTPARW
jgi:hypothetical protein